jgi:adenosylmethionine-8-amino-7-oxononanoate aminotransferase
LAGAVMSLKGAPGVLDIRTLGLIAAIALASRPTPTASAPPS